MNGPSLKISPENSLIKFKKSIQLTASKLMLRADSPSRAPPGHYREFYPLHDFQTPFFAGGKIHILNFRWKYCRWTLSCYINVHV